MSIDYLHLFGLRNIYSAYQIKKVSFFQSIRQHFSHFLFHLIPHFFSNPFADMQNPLPPSAIFRTKPCRQAEIIDIPPSAGAPVATTV